VQGLVLTQTHNLAALLEAMRAARVPLLKVITSWGWPWDDASRAQVCAMPELIVRTTCGDGCAPPTDAPIRLDPATVLAEIEPWARIRPTLWVELGNEPNAADPSDQAAWDWRYWTLETITQVRTRYPLARLISAGLREENQYQWWLINSDVFRLCDAVGFHAYAYHDFTPGDTGQIERAIAQLFEEFPDKLWSLTEAGINDAATASETKAARYAELHRALPSNAIHACWYHTCEEPLEGSADQAAYALPISALGALQAGGTIA
jgi:hypothetical protein